MFKKYSWFPGLLVFFVFNNMNIVAQSSDGFTAWSEINGGYRPVGIRSVNNKSIPSEQNTKNDADSSWYTLKNDMKGKVHKPGEIINIQWEAGGEAITGAIVSISTDGNVWAELNPDGVIFPDAPDWGKVDWTVREQVFADGAGFISLISTTVRLRVMDYTNKNIVDYSELFTIQSSNSIQSENRNPSIGDNFNIALGPRSLNFTHPIKTPVHVSVYGISGDRIGEFKIHKGGNPHLQFKNTLSSGFYIISIQSASQRFFTRKTIQN